MSASIHWQGVKSDGRIGFESVYDIPKILGMGDYRCTLFSTQLAAVAVPFVPASSTVESEAESVDLVDEGAQIDHDSEPRMDDREVHSGSEVDEGSGPLTENYEGAVSALDVSSLMTYEEEKAARIIQAAYRMSRRIQRGKLDSIRHAKISNHFAEYLARAMEIEWPPENHSRYLFLGLMPHLLFCVESLLNYIRKRKKEATKSLLTKSHHDLEDVGAQITSWR